MRRVDEGLPRSEITQKKVLLPYSYAVLVVLIENTV